ncbi:MAG: hypothetical protein ACOZIN_02330 [Myxococcota bacterium]
MTIRAVRSPSVAASSASFTSKTKVRAELQAFLQESSIPTLPANAARPLFATVSFRASTKSGAQPTIELKSVRLLDAKGKEVSHARDVRYSLADRQWDVALDRPKGAETRADYKNEKFVVVADVVVSGKKLTLTSKPTGVSLTPDPR